MREALTLVLAAALAGCAAGPREEALVPMGTDLVSFHRVGVLPFSSGSDPYRRALERALFDLGLDVVPAESVAASLKELGVAPGEPLGPATLQELRERTKAEALLFGTLVCPRLGRERRLSVLLLDTQGGEPVFRMSYSPRTCGGRADAAEAARHVAERMKTLLKLPDSEQMDHVQE